MKKFKVIHNEEEVLFSEISEAIKYVESHNINNEGLEIKPIEGCSYTEAEMMAMYFGEGRIIGF